MKPITYALAMTSLLMSALPSLASGIGGDTIDVSYYYPDTSTLFHDAGQFVVPSSGIDTLGYGEEFVSLSANAVNFSFSTTDSFTPSSFNGVVFTDLTSNSIASVSIDPSTNIVGLTAADLSFTSNSISLNTEGLSFTTDTTIQLDINGVVSAVPLPASAPLFGAALLALGAVGYGLKRKTRAAAA